MFSIIVRRIVLLLKHLTLDLSFISFWFPIGIPFIIIICIEIDILIFVTDVMRQTLRTQSLAFTIGAIMWE